MRRRIEEKAKNNVGGNHFQPKWFARNRNRKYANGDDGWSTEICENCCRLHRRLTRLCKNPNRARACALVDLFFRIGIHRASLARRGDISSFYDSGVPPALTSRTLLPAAALSLIGNLLNVVHQAVQMPLRVDLALAAKGEAV